MSQVPGRTQEWQQSLSSHLEATATDIITEKMIKTEVGKFCYCKETTCGIVNVFFSGGGGGGSNSHSSHFDNSGGHNKGGHKSKGPKPPAAETGIPTTCMKA